MMMNRWDPFRDIMGLQDQINQLFDSSLLRREGRREPPESAWQPLVDVKEKEEGLVLMMDLPGIDEKEVDITVSGDHLLIKGERKPDKEEKRYLRRERPVGSFFRSFLLSLPVSEEKIKATYRNGVLEILLPRLEEAKPKKVMIESN